MAKHIEINPVKTYATRENAIKAVEKKGFADEVCHGGQVHQLRYIIMTHTDGRFFPLFLGETAIQAGAHFHFNVAG
jgi:hypothetical protein